MMPRKKLNILIILGLSWVTLWGKENLNYLSGDYEIQANKIINSALNDTSAFERLVYLCDTFGPRLSGSRNLELAIDWILEEMKKDGLDNVHGEKVMVPNWKRGLESAEMIEPWSKKLNMLGLGGSVATPEAGITAEVLVVDSFEDLLERAAAAKDKIVLFNVPFTTYGETVKYRWRGASAAAQAGAVASLVRSVGTFSMDTPHTGGMGYEEGVRKIPHAAISMEAAAMMSRMAKRGQKIKIRLKMEARTEKDAVSRNIIAEIKGTEKPEEIVVLGGHIDSWDVGQGAMDDAGGCVAAWQALNLIKTLGLRPKRTIRVVLWTNEENGTQGGKQYAVTHAAEVDNHILAIESDGGVFSPEGFGFGGSEEALYILRNISKLLQPVGADSIFEGGGGADIGPLMKKGVPGMGLRVEGSKYFWYHHTNADTWDILNLDEFNRCVASMAVMAFVVADMENILPRKINKE